MKVLIPTLCQQGQLYSDFAMSLQLLNQYSAQQKQQIHNQIIKQIPNFDEKNPEHQQTLAFNMAHHTIEFGVYTQGGESLLARGRNHAAQVALTQGWDKILFIDADEGFTWSDVYALVGSPHPISAGLVPLKTYPVPGSFETVLNFLPFVEDEIFFDNSLRTLRGTLRMSNAKKSHWIEVPFTGTGFLCVDTSVFAKLAETCDEYIYPSPATGVPELHWAFFDGGPIDDRYFSEDWAFCQKARAAGYKVMVNTNVRVTHVGPHKFVVG